MRGGPSPNQFTEWQKKVWGDGTGVPVPPNLGGERVVSKPKRQKAEAARQSIGDAAEGFSTRRALLFGVLIQPIFFGVLKGPPTLPSLKGTDAKREQKLIGEDSYYDGDAVTSPELEVDLIELLAEPRTAKTEEQAKKFIGLLEARGGSQIGRALPLGACNECLSAASSMK